MDLNRKTTLYSAKDPNEMRGDKLRIKQTRNQTTGSDAKKNKSSKNKNTS